MGAAAGSDAVAGVAGPGAGGIVSRPRLFERLGASARVSVISAPPGSGKTVLLRSWISQASAAGSTAWVTVRRGERNSQQFWLSMLGALRQTPPGLVLVQPLTAAPDLEGWAIAERLLKDLAPSASGFSPLATRTPGCCWCCLWPTSSTWGGPAAVLLAVGPRTLRRSAHALGAVKSRP